MDLKNAISNLRRASTACQKASEVIEVVKDQDQYAGNSTIIIAQNKIEQVVGRIEAITDILDFVHSTLQQEE
jgi:hypothetical protein